MRTRQRFLWTICSCSLLIWAGTRSWGYEPNSPAPIGISGLLPELAPSGLAPDDFTALAESLGENWRTWAEETGQFVTSFYEEEHPTIESQREALRRLRVKLKTIETALADGRYRSIHPQLADLYGNLAPQVAVADAALDTLTVDAEAARRRRLDAAFNELRQTISQLRQDLRNFQGGSRWLPWINADRLTALNPDDADWLNVVNEIKSKLERRETYGDEIREFLSREPFLALEDALAYLQSVARPQEDGDPQRLRELLGQLLAATGDHQKEANYENESRIRGLFQEIRNSAPDGGEMLSAALQEHYFNFNLRLTVSEGLLNRFVSDVRRETSAVSERMMEAYVRGHQWTTTNVSLNLRPSSHDARFDLVLDGTVQSSTTGFAQQATIQTVGRHSFRAEKPVIFNGQEFLTSPANVTASANNQPVGATTRLNHVPIVRRIASNIAMREASARLPQANALAAQRIRTRVSGELNREVDQQFANASMDLQAERYGPLREQGLYPDAMNVSSTNRELLYWSRLMSEGELGGSAPALPAAVPSRGLIAQVHESLMTNSVERFGLNGKTMTEAEARRHLEEQLSKLLGREFRFGEASEVHEEEPPREEGTEPQFVFAERDAVRFSIGDGNVTLFIRAGLRREGMEDIPEQLITVPIAISINDEGVLLTRGTVRVTPIERAPSPAAQITRANVMRQRIQSALPERTIDATYEIEQGNRKVTLRISEVAARGGWLTVTMQ